MIELNENFLAGFMAAVLANCLLAFLIGFFRALLKDRKKIKEAPLRMPEFLETPVLQTCDKCNGTGRMKSEVGEDQKCDVCFGRGQAFGAIREAFVPGDCLTCGGWGFKGTRPTGRPLNELQSERRPCPTCNGTGKSPEGEDE